MNISTPQLNIIKIYRKTIGNMGSAPLSNRKALPIQSLQGFVGILQLKSAIYTQAHNYTKICKNYSSSQSPPALYRMRLVKATARPMMCTRFIALPVNTKGA